jgi:hypothetical protein
MREAVAQQPSHRHRLAISNGTHAKHVPMHILDVHAVGINQRKPADAGRS